MPELHQDVKKQLAFALILLREWMQTENPKDFVENGLYMFRLADAIGVRKELEDILPVAPMVKVVPK